MQRANKLGIPGFRRNAERRARRRGQRDNIGFADLPQAPHPARASTTAPSATRSAGRMTLQLLRQRDVIGRINISPRELEQFWPASRPRRIKNAEYNVSHILVSVPVSASPEQIEAREKRAKEVFEKATSGDDFASSRSPTPTAAPTSKAARSAGAAARSCRPSSPRTFPR